MPRRARCLTVREIEALPPRKSLYAVGGVAGLYVKVNEGGSLSYSFKYRDANGERVMGLGNVSLADARAKAKELRRAVDAGRSPLEEKRAEQKAVEARKYEDLTFEAYALQWVKEQAESGKRWRNNKRGRRFYEGAFSNHVFPVFGSKPLGAVDASDILRCLERMSDTFQMRAKVKTCIKQVFAGAKVAGVLPVSFPNPVMVAEDVLRELPAPQHSVNNRSAVAVAEVPRLYRELCSYGCVSALCLAFMLLTGARSQAAREARWGEIDLSARVWSVPLEHDKVKAEAAQREIFLSDEAVSFLRKLPRIEGEQRLFPSPVGGTLLSNSLRKTLKRMHCQRFALDGCGWIDPEKSKRKGEPCVITPHGLRAAFRTWARDDEHGNNRELDQKAAEMCLLHKPKDVHNGAYDRAGLKNERRRIMALWGIYCTTGKWPGEVPVSNFSALPIIAANKAA